MSKHRRYYSGYLGILLILAGIVPAVTCAEPTLILNSENEPPFSTPERDGYIDVIATEAFRRAGLKLKLIKVPAERALLNANAGIDDGDLTRIKGLEKIYPNLVMVPEKLMDWEFVAFSKVRDENIDWAKIKQKTVGHITGWKIYEHILQGAPHVVSVSDAKQLFVLLEQDRLDIALYAQWMGQQKLREMGLDNIHQLNPVLERREMYIYLNRSHEKYVEKIAAALRALKKEGFYDREKDRALSTLKTLR